MALDTGVDNLPEYAKLIVGGVVAIIVGVVTRLGWVSAKTREPEQHVEMAGAVVDSRAVKTLVDAIDFAMDRITDLHDMRMRHDKKQADDSEDLRKEIRLLREAIQQLSVRKENSNGG